MISDEDEIYLHTRNSFDNASNTNSNDEWGFDDDDILSQASSEKLPSIPKSPPKSIYKHLSHQDYIEEISAKTQTSSQLKEYHMFLCQTTPAYINKKFMNVGNDANELLEYYLSRPQLFDYTFNTELHRMGYTVKDEYGGILNDMEDIRRYNKRQDLLLWRAANQSLLADAIQNLTGCDNVIRPQFLSTVVATKCHFTVDIPKNTIVCDCDLVLSLPMESGRLELATIQIQIYFYLNQKKPELQMKLIDINPKDLKQEQLNAVSTMLSSQGMMEFNEQQIYTSNTTNFRDALANTTTGMSHTLKQMDAVMNVKGKLGFFKNLNALLPSADLLAAVEEEDSAFVPDKHKSHPLDSLANHRPNPLDTLASHQLSNHQQRPNPLDNLANHSRPTTKNPLLGGMVRNLIIQQPKKEPVRLYNIDKPRSPLPLKLYNLEETKPPIKEENGWSDDEFDYFDDTVEKDHSLSITKVFDHDTIILNHEYDIIPTRKRWNRCAVMIR